MNSDQRDADGVGHQDLPDPSLEDVVATYVDRLTDGEKLERLQILAEEPELGLQILEHLEAFVDMGSSSNDTPPLGTLGDYTLRRQTGRGGMGVVYEAWENSMDRKVALKVLPAGIAADERAVARFIREAQLAGRLNHANVVSVYGMGVKEQTPYYAMEFVEGETLGQVLAGLRDAAPETETPFGSRAQVGCFAATAKAFADVADGLQHAHSKGVIHRDIKPSNLILDREGRLRILDFGLARLEGQESLTLSGDLVGTPAYMSPEQARRKKVTVDHRTDVYSLGATLYELLTQQQPFRGKDHQDTLSQIIERDPQSPRQLDPRVPQDLETIVLKCLRKDAGDRYGTAEALAQDLRRFVRGDSVEARPQSRWEKLARRVTPYMSRILAVAVALLVTVVAGAVFYLHAEKRLRERVARTEEAVRSHLTEAGDLWRQAVADAEGLAKLRDALAAAETAAALATDGVESALQQRAAALLETLRREVDNRDMLGRLEGLPAPTERFEKREAKHHAGFAEAFRNYGIDVEALDPVPAAEKIRGSGIATELSLALEIWAELLARPEDVRASNRLTEVAMRADPDPWRNRLREAVMAGNIDEAKRLAAEVDVARISDRRIAFLAAHLFNRGHRDEAESLLRRAARHIAHERSYWTNYWLGFILKEKKQLEESERYLRAAILCRAGGESGRVRAHLGDVLTLRQRLDDGVAAYTRAFRLSPGERASYGGLSRLVRSLHREERGDVLTRLIRDLGEVISSGEGHPQATRVLLAAWGLKADALEAVEVLHAARSEVERARREDEERSVQHALVLLAEVQFAAGERRDAVRTLEEAHRLFGRHLDSIQILLGKYRAALSPDLVSYASIDAAVDSVEVLLPEGAEWRFFRGRREPSLGLEWAGRTFDDSAWERGPSGFGYGDDDDATALVDMEGSYTTLYVRRRFTLPDPSLYTGFWLRVKVDDGCVAYVNDREIGRVRAGLKGEAHRATAVADINASEPLFPVNLTIDAKLLRRGENVLALQGLNVGITSSDFTLVPAVYAKREAELGRDRERFEEFRRIAERDADDGAPRLAYLEGRLLARAGDHRKAAEYFREVLDLDRRRPEPYMSLVKSLRAAGEPVAGEQVLRELLSEVEFPTPRDWNRWVAFSFIHLERTAAEMLEAIPNSRGEDYAEDLRWLLERLAAGETIRINCGGGEYRGVTGTIWGADRFHVLGGAFGNKTYSDKIANTDDDPLYAIWRAFGMGSGVAVGYALPLPPGRYRVTLHFARVYSPARYLYKGKRIRPPGLVFDVLAEGRPGLERFAALGFASADVQTFTRRVEDGILDLEFVDRNALHFVPVLSAFEVERVE